MSELRKAAEMALEALKASDIFVDCFDIESVNKQTDEAITALRQALKQPAQQEPVAWQVHPFDYGIGHEGVYARTDRPEQVEMWKRKGWTVQPLYTTPPAAQRD